jgi:hypothetical protein
VGGANIQIVHYFDHGYLEEEKSMIYSFTVTFRAKYLTGMVTSVPPYETFSLIKWTLEVSKVISHDRRIKQSYLTLGYF